ncbi:hypothetical protein [Ferroplasma sp.]|uniref:hypothetical protein n=1 Tax=Ferroplasma sp. TaxID=2591003 RepID=UPI0026032D54|nr:hypothetical protein [Ferroplasma sp.]
MNLWYGYKKGAKYLYRHGYIITKKKVRRLISENILMNYHYSRIIPATNVINSVVNVNSANQVGEFAIM